MERGAGVTEKERERERKRAAAHKAIAPYFLTLSRSRVESKARPISYVDSLTSRVHHRACLHADGDIDSLRSTRSTPWGMIGVVYDPGIRTRVCVCTCMHVACCDGVRAVPISISTHLSLSLSLTPSVHSSIHVRQPAIGSPFLPSRARGRKRE